VTRGTCGSNAKRYCETKRQIANQCGTDLCRSVSRSNTLSLVKGHGQERRASEARNAPSRCFPAADWCEYTSPRYWYSRSWHAAVSHLAAVYRRETAGSRLTPWQRETVRISALAALSATSWVQENAVPVPARLYPRWVSPRDGAGRAPKGSKSVPRTRSWRG